MANVITGKTNKSRIGDRYYRYDLNGSVTATKVVYADGNFIQTAEKESQYYYHSDHLGSAQLVTDWRGQEYERFEYTPYGEVWIEKASAVSALDVSYRFTGKERDKETGLYYYGARYLDPKYSRWLSVDPALGEYVPQAPVNDEAKKRNGNLPGMGGVFNTVNLHVYHYAGNNPVVMKDPDGRWVPDPDGNLIAESGDNATTLAEFQGIKYIEALKQLTDQGYTVNDKGILNLKIGDKVKLDNVYTRSIANASNIATDKYVNDYNCWGAAIAGSIGNEIIRGVGIGTPDKFDSILQAEYSQISASNSIFGKTVLKFDKEEETTHGAVFYGKSKDGTIYVYTKNGWIYEPKIMKLSDLVLQIPSYGSVTGYYNRK